MEEQKAETVVTKAKKARKPYVWTPQRKETFERMRQKRQELLNQKKNNKDKVKQDEDKHKRHLNELLKSTSKIRQLLKLIDDEHPTVEPPREKKEEVVVAEAKPKPKPKVIPQPKKPPTPPPEPESEEEDEEEEQEEEEEAPVEPPPKRNIQTFRYNTQISHVGLPKQPIAKPNSKPAPVIPEKKKSNLVFL
jgi:hypothetical protein